MSVIQRIRDKAAWVFGIIAVALISFILQDAFMRQGSFFRNTNTVGKVNGDKIEKDAFDKKVELYKQMYEAQRMQPQNDQLYQAAWEMSVQELLMDQQYKKLGISVTDKERGEILFGQNPPSWLKQLFTDPKTGMFDVETARNTLLQIENQKGKSIEAARDYAYIQPQIEASLKQTLMMKYQTLITQAVYVPKWMAEKMNADNNAIASIQYVQVPYGSINDSTVKVSNEDIMAYLKKHEKQFTQEEETRSLAYVTFDAGPNHQDSTEVMEKVEQIKAEFQTTPDVAMFVANKGSDIPNYDGYLGKKEIKDPAIDTIVKLPVGSVYGPYLEGNNVVLAKIVAARPIADSVKVRHILVATRQRTNEGQMVKVREDSTAQKVLDSAILAIKAGQSFDSVCLRYSDDGGSKEKGGVYDYFVSGNMVPSFNDFAFTGQKGEAKVVETEYGFHYVEILDQKGTDMGYKIAYVSRPINASNNTVSTANSAAQMFASKAQNKKQFDAEAVKDNLFPITTPDLRENDFSIMGLGESRELIRWIYKQKLGDVSGAYKIGDKYVVGVITAVNKKGLLSPQTARPMVENIVRNEKKAQIILGKFKGNSLETYAQSAGVTVQNADSISFHSPIIPTVGNEPKIVGAAFNKDAQTKVSEPIAGIGGVFVVKGLGISARPSLEGSLDDQRKMLESGMKSQIGYRSLEALRKTATIKDFRSDFY